MYSKQILTKRFILILSVLWLVAEALPSDSQSPPQQPLSSRAAFLRAQRASSRNQQQQKPNQSQPTTSTTNTNNTTNGTANEIHIPVNSAPSTSLSSPPPAVVVSPLQATTPNRTTRTADVFKDGDGYNIFVTNTCERESMQINIKTSRDFNGVIHTRNHRQKPGCTIEGNGATEYNLEISQILNHQDPAYCGVIRAKKDSPDDKDVLSVVLVVRFHKNIELSDDKFFLLNCTNRCRRPDCSNPSAKLTSPDESDNNNNKNNRLTDAGREELDSSGGEREGVSPNGPEPTATNKTKKEGNEDECTVWKFPWLITLLWCLAILVLTLLISHCIVCSSMVCKCVRTEVEEREPSVYEGATTDDEDNLYNKRNPMRIDYDNRDIYQTSNNYEPYCLDDSINQKTKSRHHRRSNK